MGHEELRAASYKIVKSWRGGNQEAMESSERDDGENCCEEKEEKQNLEGEETNPHSLTNGQSDEDDTDVEDTPWNEEEDDDGGGEEENGSGNEAKEQERKEEEPSDGQAVRDIGDTNDEEPEETQTDVEGEEEKEEEKKDVWADACNLVRETMDKASQADHKQHQDDLRDDRFPPLQLLTILYDAARSSSCPIVGIA
jgi:hypothetical protein